MKQTSKTDGKESGQQSRRRKSWLIAGSALLLAALIVLLCILLLPGGNDDTVKCAGNPQMAVQHPIEIDPNAQNMGNAKSPEEVKQETISGFQDVGYAEPADLGNGLQIVRVGTYTGAFVEDGSNRAVTDVMALLVTNTSEHFVEYAEIALAGDTRSALFKLTALPAGQSVLVMESTALAYDGSAKFDKTVLQAFSAPDKDFSLYPEIFSIKAADGVVNLINNSSEDITGNLAIFYKNVQDGIYLGGITYSRTLSNGVSAGAVAQFMTDSYTVASSELVFIRYEK